MRAEASADPPLSFRATRWYVVDVVGVTVFTPAEGTVPIPSIEIEVALVVLQLNCAWSPAEITVGEMVSCAVGGPVCTSGAVSEEETGLLLCEQPETAATAINRRAGVNKAFRSFKRILLFLSKGLGLRAIPFLVSVRVTAHFERRSNHSRLRLASLPICSLANVRASARRLADLLFFHFQLQFGMELSPLVVSWC